MNVEIAHKEVNIPPTGPFIDGQDWLDLHLINAPEIGSVVVGDPASPTGAVWLQPGGAGKILTTHGTGVLPTWEDANTAGNHVLLSSQHPDTAPASVVRGDLIVGDSTPLWARLAKGAVRAIFQSDGIDVAWVTAPVFNPFGINGFTQGSIPFMGASVIEQDNNDLFWQGDIASLRLFGGTVGGSGSRVISIGGVSAVVPTARPADSVQMFAFENSAGKLGLNIWTEDDVEFRVGDVSNGDGGFAPGTHLKSGSEYVAFVYQDNAWQIIPDNSRAFQVQHNTGHVGLKVAVNDTLSPNNLIVGAERYPSTGLGALWLNEPLVALDTSGETDMVGFFGSDEGVAGGWGAVMVEEHGMQQRLGGELVHLRGVGNPYKDVVSTAAETSIYPSARSLNANMFGTFREIYGEIIGDFLNNTGAGDKFVLRIKVGSTTVLNFSLNDWAASASRYGWCAWFKIGAAGATNALVAQAEFRSTNLTGINGTGLDVNDVQKDRIATHTDGITEDGTGALTFDVTIQNDTNSANESCRIFSIRVFLR